MNPEVPPRLTRLELITDPKLLKRTGAKVSKWRGIRTGEKLIRYIVNNGIECIGIAAPQVGIYQRVFILYDGKNFATFINPRILESSQQESLDVEGCLSIPGKRFKVRRPSSIVVKDALRPKPVELEGWSARAWLHEFDHLKGILISDIGEAVADESKFTL